MKSRLKIDWYKFPFDLTIGFKLAILPLYLSVDFFSYSFTIEWVKKKEEFSIIHVPDELEEVV